MTTARTNGAGTECRGAPHPNLRWRPTLPRNAPCMHGCMAGVADVSTQSTRVCMAGVCEHNFDDADLRLQTAGPTNGDVYSRERTRARARRHTHW